MSAVPVWIDTDAGVDDAIALMCALRLDKMELIRICGISAVSGNCECEKTYTNARNVLALLGREDIPVYKGADKPIVEERESAGDVHGEDGLGGAFLPASSAVHQTLPAWDAIWECAQKEDGKLQLILIGPETNAALALQKYPRLKEKLSGILVMGGAEVGGNKTPAAEFNIWADPHAAQKVFKSGVPLVMCGLDVTMKAAITRQEMDKIESGDHAMCRFFREATPGARKVYSLYAGDNYYVHDACPILYCAFPDMFRGEEAGVFVETQGRITRGKTVSDRDTDIKFGTKNALVVLDLDRERFAGFIMDTLSGRWL